MIINKVFRVIILLLIFTLIYSNVGQVNASGDEFDIMREEWRASLNGGGGSLDTGNPIIASIIATTNDEAQLYWDLMDKTLTRTLIFSDIPYSTISSSYITDTYRRLKTMTLAYDTLGGNLYHNPLLLIDIIEAMDFIEANWYNETIPQYENWWHWEIGAPLRIVDISVILYDELTPVQLTSYMNTIYHFVPDNSGKTGGNLTDLSKIILLSGIINKDSNRIIYVKNTIGLLFDYVSIGDGFYMDGSFIQHTDMAYVGTYGAVLFEGIGDILNILSGSTWDITDPDKGNVFKWVYDSVEPLLYKGAVMDMVSGRGISRYEQSDHFRGSVLLNGLIKLSHSATGPDADRIKSIVKYHIQQDISNTFIPAIGEATYLDSIMNDTLVIPSTIKGSYAFNMMDKSVHQSDAFAFGISKSSKITQRWEVTNGEDHRGWHRSDGATFIYNGDLNQYSENYWPTVNNKRLAGITVDTRPRSDGTFQIGGDGEGNPTNAWSGGTILGDYGISGMELFGYEETLTAKKSWFMFDDEIIAIGSGITSTDNRTIETIVENRKLNSSGGDNVLIVDGSAKPSTLGWSENMNTTNWINLEGNVTGSDIGYYFPDSSNIKGLRETRTGAWSDINDNGSSTIEANNFMTLLFDHGTSPTNASYSYALLPNKTSAQMSAYAAAPDFTIIENSTSVHAVKENSLNILGINTWYDITKTVDIVTVNKKASIMVKENMGSSIEISIADPTKENTGTINVEIDRSAFSILSADPGITVTQISPTIKFTVNVNESHGQAFKANFNLNPNGTTWYSKSDYSEVHSIGSTNTGIVTTEFDVTPLTTGINAVVGYSDTSTTVTGYSSFAMIIRLYNNGFDVRNGASYSSDTTVPYSLNTQYHIRMVTDLDSKTYDVYVTPDGGSETQLASNYAFRSDAPTTDDLGQLCLQDVASNQIMVENHEIVTAATPWNSKSDYTEVHNLGSTNTGVVTTEFDVTPLKTSVNAVVGYTDTSTSISSYSSLAIIIRLYGGNFDVRNGGAYTSLTTLPYSINTKYHVRLVSDLDAKTYDVYITPPEGQSETQIASNYSFRSDAPPLTDDLGQLCLKDIVNNEILVENHEVINAQEVLVDLIANEDAFVRSGNYSNINYGSSTNLTVKGAPDTSSYCRKSFLKFDLSSITDLIIQAKVSLHMSYVSATASTQYLFEVLDNNWSESTLTWNDQPTNLGVNIATWAPVQDTEVVIDITSAVQNAMIDDKILSLMIESEPGGGDLNYNSKDNASEKPMLQLIVEVP